MYNNTIDLSKWMSFLSKEKQDVPITQLKLVGSHNSASYKVNYALPIDKKMYLYLMKYTHYFGTSFFVSRWVKCQELSIYDQLKLGVRFLDLRIAYRETDNTFYCTHTFTCCKLVEVLSDIKRFIKEHDTEILLINISIDSVFKYQNYDKIINDMTAIFYKILDNELYQYIPTNILPSYNEIKTLQKSILLFFNIYYIETEIPTYFWPNRLINSKWHNQQSVDKLLVKCEDTMKKIATDNNNQNTINVAQLILTPNKNSVIKGLSGLTSIRKFSKIVENKITSCNFLNNAFILSATTVYLFDFITLDIVKRVIERNF